MAALAIDTYLRRAQDYFQAMRLLQDDDLYLNASALLAIHSAISSSDALRQGLGLTKLASDDHYKAADSLLQSLRARQFDEVSGIEHLRYLLTRKSAVAYGSQRIDAKEARRLIQKAERFSYWITRTGQKLNIEGWHDGSD